MLFRSVSASMIGSVADKVCRTVPVPVMFIRPPETPEGISVKKRLLSRILVPLDGSELSLRALTPAKELATRLPASITLFQMSRIIVPYAEASMLGVTTVNYAQWNEDVKTVVENELSTLEKKLREENLTVTHRVTVGTDAASEIIEAGKKVGADLVVMSTHGASGLSKWVLGSVAEKVLRNSDIPLLLVNARVK